MSTEVDQRDRPPLAPALAALITGVMGLTVAGGASGIASSTGLLLGAVLALAAIGYGGLAIRRYKRLNPSEQRMTPTQEGLTTPQWLARHYGWAICVATMTIGATTLLLALIYLPSAL